MASPGTLMSWDSLWQSNETILELGEENVFRTLQLQLQAHNAQLQNVLSDFVEVVNDTVRGEFQDGVFGADDVIYLDPIAELGVAEAAKTTAGDTMGFPIEAFARSVQWTRLAFEMMTGAELARQFDAIRKGNAIQVRNSILNALFFPTNRSVVDRLTNGQTLAVKALCNADSGFIPPNPYGVEFDSSTHTHYIANATLTEAKIDELLTLVTEHYISGQPRIYINKAQEATVRGFTGSFLAYQPAAIIPGITNDRAAGTLNTMSIDNRAIGLWDGTAEIWVKPWMPANYLIATVLGQPKPVRMRQRRGGLYIAADLESHPLRARMLQHEYGCGILERTNAAILRCNNGTYAAPTL